MVLSLYLMHKLKEEFLFLLGLNLIIQPLVLHIISNVTRGQLVRPHNVTVLNDILLALLSNKRHYIDIFSKKRHYIDIISNSDIISTLYRHYIQ